MEQSSHGSKFESELKLKIKQKINVEHFAHFY